LWKNRNSTDRFAGFQAQWLNVHVDFPLLQRIALPIGGWTANQIHQAVLTTFHLSDKGYGLNQLRYDLRKLRGHGLIERDGSRYAYRLTPKGVQVALVGSLSRLAQDHGFMPSQNPKVNPIET
jgi:hypothetical protein